MQESTKIHHQEGKFSTLGLDFKVWKLNFAQLYFNSLNLQAKLDEIKLSSSLSHSSRFCSKNGLMKCYNLKPQSVVEIGH